MDNADALAPASLTELLRLLDPEVIEPQLAQAEHKWLRRQLLGDVAWQTDGDLIVRAHQVMLVAADVVADLGGMLPTELRQQLDQLATVLDLSARLDRTQHAVLARLAAHLFLRAGQPTKAYRTSRAIDEVETDFAGQDQLLRALRDSYRLEGAPLEITTIQSLAAGLEGLEARNAEDVLTWAASRSDAFAFSVAEEIGAALDYRRQHDLLTVVGSRLTPDYIERAYSSSGRYARRRELLPPQRDALTTDYFDAPSVLVTTPTGTGKTFLAELRILDELRRNAAALCVYVAPLNALARQVHREFGFRLASVANVVLWTGAYEIDPTIMELGGVLVTTPEKLDAIVRQNLSDDPRSQDLLRRLSLLVCDEIHQVADGGRGIRYEMLIARLRWLKKDLNVLALSAVRAQPESMAQWLGNGQPAHMVRQNWQPARVWDLIWRRDGGIELRNDYEDVARVPRPLDVKPAAAHLASTLLEQNRSVLLVEMQRNWAESLAKELFDQYRDSLARRFELNTGPRASWVQGRLDRLAGAIESNLYLGHPLTEYIRVGLAYHHAGVPPQVRRAIEELGREEVIHTIVSTTTLAEGVDLPFRAVILVRTELPFGRKLQPTRVRNIRGRVARPRYSNDGVFAVLQPKNPNSVAHQFFLDHYWTPTTTGTTEKPSALLELYSSDRMERAVATRSLQGQLLALFSEREVELEDVSKIAFETLVAASFPTGSPVIRGVARAIQVETERALKAPALLKVASPVSPTPLGRAAVLGGLSAESAILIRNTVVQADSFLVERLASNGAAWVASRCAWLAWEVVEASDAYRSRMATRSGAGYPRVPGSGALQDERLEAEYALTETLLNRLTFDAIAEEFKEENWLRGRSHLDRVGFLVEWANKFQGLLPWTLSGAMRIVEAASEDAPLLQQLVPEIEPFVQYFASWVASPTASQVVRSGWLDRDSTLRLFTGADLWNMSLEDLIEWTWLHEESVVATIGEEAADRLLRRVPVDDDEAPAEGE